MKELRLETTIRVHSHMNELDETSKLLIQRAQSILPEAYAPYSHFHVAAAILLSNGQIVTGTNQENASFPLGLCAERIAVAAAASLYPNAVIELIAITIKNFNKPTLSPVSPCGTCRQVLLEKEHQAKKSIRILLKSESDEIYEVEKVSDLLPLSFVGDIIA
jgi:cytidine deaminase